LECAIERNPDDGQWLALAAIREAANLVELDTGQDERAISTFSFDMALIQAQCLNDQLKERFDFDAGFVPR
jgi:hypothetical protein